MRGKMIMLISVLSLLASLSIAQSAPIKGLKVGDTMPDLNFDKILNYSEKKIKISDFRGKLLILDFWNAYCTVCLKEFPRLQTIQQKFGSKLMILAVGFDSRDGDIIKLIQKRKELSKPITIPSIVQSLSDTTLRYHFPTQGYPHEIWIGPRGTIIGITDQFAVTEQNIDRVLATGSIDFKPYTVKIKLDPDSDFLIQRKKDNKILTYGSAITGYIDSLTIVGSRFGTQFDSSITRLFLVNQTIFELYRLAYQRPDWKNRIMIEKKDGQFYKVYSERNNGDNWQREKFNRENLFSYELILPKFYSVADACKVMIQDLDRYFCLSSNIEKRIVSYYALVQKNPQGKYKSNNFSVGSSEFSDDGLDAIFRNNANMGTIIGQLNDLIPDYNILNETGYNGKVNLEWHLSGKFTVDDIQRELKKYDLDLIFTQRPVDVLVLKVL